MTPIRRLALSLTSLLALLAVWMVVPSLAWAQAVAPSAPSPTDPLMVTAVLVAISGALAFLRSVAPSESWAHTKAGAMALVAAGAVLTAIYGTVQAHGLDGHAVLLGALGAVSSLFAVTNPSAKAIAKGAALVLPALLALGVSGCAGAQMTAAQKAQYTQEFSDCCKVQGENAAGGIGAQVLSILNQDAAGVTEEQVLQQLEGIGVQTGAAGVQLVVSCAVQAWMAVHPAAPGQPVTSTMAAARRYRLKHLARGAVSQ